MRPFAKYEGLGNDFIVLDAREWPLDGVGPELARTLCDRHRGVGGDGILWVAPGGGGHGGGGNGGGGGGAGGGSSNSGVAHEQGPRLVIYNADGSRAGMCGNGVRCVG